MKTFKLVSLMATISLIAPISVCAITPAPHGGCPGKHTAEGEDDLTFTDVSEAAGIFEYNLSWGSA